MDFLLGTLIGLEDAVIADLARHTQNPQVENIGNGRIIIKNCPWDTVIKLRTVSFSLLFLG